MQSSGCREDGSPEVTLGKSRKIDQDNQCDLPILGGSEKADGSERFGFRVPQSVKSRLPLKVSLLFLNC